VNREVVTAVLESLGCRVSVAENGRQALDVCCAERFDLVLMDIQMPEMDGRQATIGIRAHEATADLTRMPIVALTANALKEDRDACLAAGMDDYLVKPVSREQLWAVLSRWLRDALPSDPDGPPRAAGGVVAPRPRGVETAMDVDLLMSLPGVNGNRASPMLQRLLPLFVGETERNLVAMRAGVAAGDADAVRALAHKMKSGCLAVGAVWLASRARSLDERIKAGGTPTGDGCGCHCRGLDGLQTGSPSGEAGRRGVTGPGGKPDGTMTASESARVLVVDDDPLTRLMASEALREGGSLTLEAKTGSRP
jgi:two-component system sensor histidine kinase/response regulator